MLKGFQLFLEVRQLADSFSADLIFLSEPWIFQTDLLLVTDLMRPGYKMFQTLMICMIRIYLSLKLKHMKEPLHSEKKNWTLSLQSWEQETSRVTGIVLETPYRQTTLHINIYTNS